MISVFTRTSGSAGTSSGAPGAASPSSAPAGLAPLAPEKPKAAPRDGQGRPVSAAKREQEAKARTREAAAKREAEAKGETAWVEIALVEDDGRPAAGLFYRVVDTRGREFTGELDGAGKARVEGLAPGEVRVTFPPRHDGASALETAEETAAPRAAEASAPVAAPSAAAKKVAAFVELALIDEDGEPHADVSFTLVDAEGRAFQGRTDAKGAAKVTGIADGPARVTFDV